MNVPPGPRGLDALGFLGKGKTAGTIEFLERTARQYGPVSSFRILHKRLYLVDDAELIKEILVTRQHSFERDSGAQLLRELVGDGLLTREEPQHRERRRMLQPAFHKEQIASYAETMIRECERTSHEWADGATLDIRKEMRRLTLTIVGATMFGVDFCGSAAAVADVLQSVARRSRWLAPLFAFIEPFAVGYRKLFPHGPSLFFRRERAELERVIAPIIRERRGAASKDMLSLLLSERDEEGGRLTDEDMKNEIVTFVLAGHETTATALTWTWYLLAGHPRVEERLHAEVDSVLGDRAPMLEDLPRLSYTNMVFQESLRLYPPALAFARRAKHKLELGGYPIVRGTSIFLSPYVTQRNPRYFEAPEEFRPERWETKPSAQFAYFPFGGGAKMCIGEPFAKLEAVLALATLARQWKLENTNNGPVAIKQGLLLNPDQAIVMRAKRRRPANTQIYVEHVTAAS
jgi:cytochrome P450